MDIKDKSIVILTGPTAVGKTELSINLAKKIDGEIISCDSIAVYKGMDIGSAKIEKKEMQGVSHFLIDELDPDEDFSVFTFKQYATKYIDEIISRGHIPILTGGTGFYIQSVLYDIDFSESNDDGLIRKELENLYKKKGEDYLYDLLKEVDPEYAEIVHKNNVKRVIRAIDFFRQTNTKLSEHNSNEMQKTSPYNFAYFVLNDDRKNLYDRINKRVDIMVEQGLFAEVKSLKEKGYGRDLVSMQGIGYKEVYMYLDGEISKEEAIELIKKNTRHFAKRQLTWFRREKEVIMINKNEFDYDEDKILEYMMKEIEHNNVK